MCTWLHAGTHTCPCTHVYRHKHRLILVYMCAHGSRHTYPDPFTHHCTPTYTDRKLHVYTDGIHSHAHTLAYGTAFNDLKASTCPFAHSIHSCTCSPLLSMLSNHEFTGRPLVSSTMELRWFNLPSLPLPSSSFMTGSCSSCQPQCLPSGFPPQGSPDP